METAPEPLLGFDFEKTNLCALKRVHRAQKHTTMGLSYLTAPKACNKTLFALSIISRPRKIYKKKITSGKEPNDQKWSRYLIRSVSTVQLPVAFQRRRNAASTCTHVLTRRAGWRGWLQTHISALRERQFVNKLVLNLKFSAG